MTTRDAPPDEVLLARYRLRPGDGDPAARADALRYEQTVEVPPEAVRDAFVRERVLPRVTALEPADDGVWEAELAIAPEVVAGDPAVLLNVLFGNCSMQDDVELVDVVLPAALATAWGGPRHGIGGIRALTGVAAGPLTCSALKPMGLGPEALGELAETLAGAGLHVLKDDHGLADHPFCPFEARVRAVLAGIERAARATGRRALYAPNLIGPPHRLARQLEVARRLGVEAALVAPGVVGFPALFELAHADPPLALLVHPALSGGPRMHPAVWLGTLARAFGGDASIFPHAGGRFARFDAETCRALAARLVAPVPGAIRPALPVPAGGVTVERVDEVVHFYGPDVMVLVGGSLLRAGAQLAERAGKFVAAVARAGERVLEAAP